MSLWGKNIFYHQEPFLCPRNSPAWLGASIKSIFLGSWKLKSRTQVYGEGNRDPCFQMSAQFECEKERWFVCVLACSVVSNSFATAWMVAAHLLNWQDSPGKSTGVGCHFLLQEIFPTQGSNPGLRIADRRFTVWATREATYTQWNITHL